MKCLRPIWIQETSDTYGTEVPCGRCYNCLQTKRSVWTFRLQMELRDAESAHFITLTYDNENVPLVKQWDRHYVQTLRSKELQSFFKKLRSRIMEDANVCPIVGPEEEWKRWLKKLKSKDHYNKNGAWIEQRWAPKIRYFAVGEYGGQTQRPHYHIILFNLPIEWVRIDPFGKEFSEELEEIWKKGIVDIGKVENGSIHYVTKYHLHPLNDAWLDSDVREKPFVRMSRKPGIGANYITDEISDYYRDSKNLCATLKNGIRQPLGRYYKEKIIHELPNYRDSQIKAANQRREKEEKLRKTYKSEADFLKSERDRYYRASEKGKRMLRKNNKI